MTVQKFRTNLNCGSCVSAVRPHLDGDPAIRRWSVDTTDPRKVLTVEGEDVPWDSVAHHVAGAGFKVLGRIDSETPVPRPSVPPLEVERKSFSATYKPLLLVFAYLVGLVTLVEIADGRFDGTRAMANFMGGFFIAFSFFKLLDLRGFSDAFRTYDVLARRFRTYAYAYPFIELVLGVAYLVRLAPVTTNLVTVVVMALGLVGVTRALAQRRMIRCACLGTVFNLPMSKVAFIEDALMGIMAFAALLAA